MTETRQIDVIARRMDTSSDGRTVEVVAVPFGETLELMGGMFREEISPDVEVMLRDGHSLPMLWRHDEQIGAWQRNLKRTDSGLVAVGRISDTTLGRDVATLLADDAMTGASIGFRVTRSHTEQRESAVEMIDGIELFEISLTPIPAYTGARLQSVREHRKDQHMPTDAPELRDLTPRVEQIEQSDTEIREILAGLRDQVDTLTTADRHPLDKYRSLADYQAAVYSGEETRALVGQVTGDNPGLINPTWLTQIQGIVDRPRTVVNAFGAVSLPGEGMDIDWPYLNPSVDLDAIIAEQVNQLDELNSVKVDFLKGTAGITTHGAASAVAYQLIMRSSPSYREGYLRVLTNAYARYTEAAFTAAVTAAAAGSVVGGAGVLTDKSTATAAIIEASADVDDATGAPASFVIAAKDVWLALSKLFADTPPAYGTQNTPGVAQASTLRTEVSGLPVLRSKYAPAGTLLVSNDMSGTFYDSGAMLATSEDVAKLGQNVAVWGMDAATFEYPAGIVAVPTA